MKRKRYIAKLLRRAANRLDPATSQNAIYAQLFTRSSATAGLTQWNPEREIRLWKSYYGDSE